MKVEGENDSKVILWSSTWAPWLPTYHTHTHTFKSSERQNGLLECRHVRRKDAMFSGSVFLLGTPCRHSYSITLPNCPITRSLAAQSLKRSDESLRPTLQGVRRPDEISRNTGHLAFQLSGSPPWTRLSQIGPLTSMLQPINSSRLPSSWQAPASWKELDERCRKLRGKNAKLTWLDQPR